MAAYKESRPDIVREVQKKYLDEARERTSEGSMTPPERNFLWKILNQALWGKVTPADETEAWKKIYQNSEASAEAKELVENARSAEQQKKDREIQVNIIFAFTVMGLVVLFLAYYILNMCYLKIVIPFLEWLDGVLIWFENNQTKIFFWVITIIVFFLCLRIFPIVKSKK